MSSWHDPAECCNAAIRRQSEVERTGPGRRLSDANDVVDDARSRHRMCQRVIVEQRITGGGRPHAG